MLTGKTIGQLTYLSGVTSDTLFPVELSGTTYHINFSSIAENVEVVNEVSYLELVSNITGNTLTIGSYYLITDFRTCYDQPDFNSIGNEIIGNNYKQSEIEPIIVFATSANTISTTAYQPKYPKDRIQYDWTFNKTERTAGVAYGRISERIDEFNNRTDYDHRTILFKRYDYIELNMNSPLDGTVNVEATSSTQMSVTGTGTNFTSLGVGDFIGFGADTNFMSYQVVSISGDTNMVITGLTNFTSSNLTMYNGYYQYDTSYYQNNITTAFTEYYTFDYDKFNVNNYIGNYANSYFYDENSFILANNVFKGSTYRNNTFGDMCYNNSFDDDCTNNIIGNYFYNNITDDDFDSNVIANYFNNNKITSNFYNNRIGENFQGNYLVQSSFYRNNIGNNFQYNIIDGDDFQNNEIGNQFNNNTILNSQFYKNDIGNGYNLNKTYAEFYGNLLGNGFNNNTIYSAFYDNQISEYFGYNTIGYEGNYSEFHGNIIGPGFYSNEISGNTFTNRIGEQFENNTIYSQFYDNQIFNEYKGNITYGEFYLNKVDWGFSSNQISGYCESNTFGPYTVSNDFLGGVFGNVLKGSSFGNVIGDVFTKNNIGYYFSNNVISQNFQNNEIGSWFYDNTIGEGFGFGGSNTQKNYIGDNFYENTVSEYFYNNRITNNFFNNTVGDYFQSNVIDTPINSFDFTINYGNITAFTYSSDVVDATDNIYYGVSGSTNDLGVNATFDIEVSGGTVVGVSGNTQGQLYSYGDIIIISGYETGKLTGPIDTFTIPTLSVSVYKPEDSTYPFPSNETQMDYLIDNSPLYDVYSTPNLTDVSYSFHTGIDQNNYAMVIDGTITIPSNGTYYFGLNSDDGSDAFIDGIKVADWYGAHGSGGSTPQGIKYPITLSTGTYSLKVRLQENSGGDVVKLKYSFDQSTWNDIPDQWFVDVQSGITGTYTNVPSSGGTGSNATFDITVVDNLVDTVILNNGGTGYTLGDTLIISGSSFGGVDIIDDITIVLTSIDYGTTEIIVTGVSFAPSVYESYTCQIFEKQGGGKRLSYYDSSDILTIKNINT